MDRQSLIEQVHWLRREGKSIRAVAAELGVHPSSVQRALRSLDQSAVPERLSESPSRVQPDMFVGRQHELGQLISALEDAIAGHGCVVLVAGEPGIGKTRLVQELSVSAQQHRVQVLWGRCYEEPGAPPYWPWVQMIRAYIQEHRPEQLRSTAGMGAGDIAQIVPEVREALPEVNAPPRLEPEQARFRLFDSTTTFLKNVSRSRPLVLVLDNLHWADRPSLMLLEFLCQELADARLLVIGTYRDAELSSQHALSQTLGELTKYPYFQRIPLSGLELQDIHNLIEQSVGVTPSQALTVAVHQRTQGNPLFITELVKMLLQEGRLLEEAAEGDIGVSWGIPDGVREAIARRLRRLSDQCNHMMTVASVVGREFGLDLMRRLLREFSGDGVLEALEEGLLAGIIEELAGPAGRFRFTHVLIQETLAKELSSARRGQWHAEIGKALDDLYGAAVEAHAGELAYHYAQAAPMLGPDKLIHYSIMAGERALSTYAHDEALGHFQRGLAAREDRPRDAQTATLLFGLGRSQLATLETNEYEEALISLNRAFDYYAEIGDVNRAVAVAQSPVLASSLSGHRTGMIDLINRALALVSPESHEAGRLLCQYGSTLYYECGEYPVARDAFVRALAIAQREGDVRLEMRTLVAAGHAEAYELHFQDALEYDLRAIDLSERVDDPYEETHARQEVASVLHRTGNLDEARRHASTMLLVAERLRHRTRLWQALQANTTVAFLEGDWQTARDFSDRALSVSQHNPNLLGYRAIIEYTLGEFDRGWVYLERLLDVMQRASPGPTFEYVYPSIVMPLVAHISGLDDRLQAAQAAAQAVLSSPSVTPVFASLAQSGLALLAVRQTDKAVADELHTALQARKGAMLGGPLDSIMSADRLLGLLAQTGGHLDAAAEHFQDAVGFCRRAGYRLELAWSLCEYGGALLQRGTPDDRADALALVEESQKIASLLGMRPLTDKAAVLTETARAASSNVPDYPGGLTQREVEVLRLIASGRSNAEIASDLVLSVRTVERHVSNIYTKIGSHGRADATAFAFTQGLMSST